MDNHIASICRFCLEDREEFQHLALSCPALWWERHTINAQDPHHSSPETWTPQQILDFAMLPKLNEAFVRPLHPIDTPRPQPGTTDSQLDTPATINSSESDLSIMDISSVDSSTTASYNSQDSLISID